ncbi:MAG: O-antigen ligase family protein [Geminicoccaceae bacterium]
MVAALWIALGGATLALMAWLGFRRPTALVWVVLATFAVGPQWLLAGQVSPQLLAGAVPAQMLLLLGALLASGARYGFRLDLVNWPLLAVLWLLAQSLVLANLDPAITPLALLTATLGFALPWCLIHVALQPGSRAHYALLIALLPALCVGIGWGLDLAEARDLFSGSRVRGDRLRGATNAGWLAFLGFIGFAVALHEAIRRRRFDFAGLALLNVLITLLSGGRMALVACGVLSVTYVLLTPALRTTSALLGLIAAIGTGALLLVVDPQLPLHELAQDPERLLDPNGRDRLWQGYLDQVRANPIFGQGLGAAEPAAYNRLPHNAYLRLLVDGGFVGLIIYAAAVLAWGRRVLGLVPPSERGFVCALFLALGVYALTDNILLMPPGLIPFLYLAVMRIPSPRGARRSRRRRSRAKQAAARPASGA